MHYDFVVLLNPCMLIPIPVGMNNICNKNWGHGTSVATPDSPLKCTQTTQITLELKNAHKIYIKQPKFMYVEPNPSKVNIKDVSNSNQQYQIFQNH